MARITIPLDASGIDNLDTKQPVKVLLSAAGKAVASKIVSLDEKGQALVAIDMDSQAQGLRVIVGPPDASDDDLLGLQTLAVDVPARRWLGRDELAIAPLRITPYYWFWWLRWCRTFTIRGRVLCADGSPVPGAVVCAYDVDAWWWWWSKQQIGCATTDASGSFTLSFRWCCGWWPWFWWSLRRWQVEPTLAGHILGALQREPRLPKIPMPDPQPDLSFFERLVGDTLALQGARAMALTLPRQDMKAMARAMPRNTLTSMARGLASLVEPSRLDGLRQRLVDRLPLIPALQAIRLWPWAPWQPWWDCTPDIIFRATQRCGREENVIVDEGWFQARWNLPEVSEVTLTANSSACCVPPPPDCIEGQCLALTHVCSVGAANVGGNGGLDDTPMGYAHPNEALNTGDAPFAGVVDIRGTMQCLSGVDYYEIEYTTTPNEDGALWHVVPPDALGAFNREYWDFDLGTSQGAGFSATVPIGGQHVYETIAHYEATHNPGDWGGSKVWLGTNIDMIFPWVTAPAFGDGTYGLQVVGYDEAGGVLSNRRVLKVCDTDTDAQIVVTIDNQSSYPAPGPDPLGNPCGGNTTHTCTDEPMTDIIDARIVKAGGGSEPVGPCGTVKVSAGDMLEVDFIAHDAQGHLAWYSLIATYGENLFSDLLGGSAVLTPLMGAAVPAAAQVGPSYELARTAPQTAAAPTWTGGAIRVSIPVAEAFPLSCCYQLELRAYKRTIVNCQGNNAHRNLSERSFQIMV